MRVGGETSTGAESSDTLAQWDYLPAQVERLDDLAQALDVWHSCAEGRPVDGFQLADAVENLRRVGNEWPQWLGDSIDRITPHMIEEAVVTEIDDSGIEIDF